MLSAFLSAFHSPFFSVFLQKKKKAGIRRKKEVLNQKKAKHGYTFEFLFSF